MTYLAVMAQHVTYLAEKTKIRLVRSPEGESPYYLPALRELGTVPMNNEACYYTTLHEFGHALGPLQNGDMLQMELGAWWWAARHSLFTINAQMAQMMVGALTTYLTVAKSWFKPPNHPIWSLYFKNIDRCYDPRPLELRPADFAMPLYDAMFTSDGRLKWA